jgi:hypothetical protein
MLILSFSELTDTVEKRFSSSRQARLFQDRPRARKTDLGDLFAYRCAHRVDGCDGPSDAQASPYAVLSGFG